MLYRFYVLLCIVAIAGCAETQSNDRVESEDTLNPATESHNSVDDSTKLTALTVLEDEPTDVSITPETVDQSTDSPHVNQPPQTQPDRTTESGEMATGKRETSHSDTSHADSIFNRQMTRIHQAIDQEQWEEAGRMLEETLRVTPNSALALDLQDFVAKQKERLYQRTLAQDFAAAMHREEWIEASKVAVNINTQDSALLEQIQRSKTLIEAEQLADRLAAKPERLSRPSIQAEVSHLRNLIADVDPGERVGTKITRLNEVSQLWTTPVEVILNSDGYTTVILRPGRSVGRFRSQTVQLMPGEYELIGRRDGFREVRKSLLLHPNSEPKTVEVKAFERF